MSKVDENLLGKLVIKYGLDREQNPKDRNRLWFKLTKEYNDITGGSHPKSKLSKIPTIPFSMSIFIDPLSQAMKSYALRCYALKQSYLKMV